MDTCQWTQTEEGQWETQCNDIFELYNGSPTENDMKFCCLCGKPIFEVKYVDPYVDDEEGE